MPSLFKWDDEEPATAEEPEPETVGVLSRLIAEKGEEYSTEIPASTTHNQQVYRLAKLCQKAGFVPYIGK